MRKTGIIGAMEIEVEGLKKEMQVCRTEEKAGKMCIRDRGHSVEDVAKSMGISTSRLYSKIYRAKNYIKDRYGDQYTEYFKYFETP